MISLRKSLISLKIYSLNFNLEFNNEQAKSDKGISKKEAQTYCDQLCKFVGELSLEVQVKLEDLIKNSLINSANTIYQDYKKQLESFSKDIDFQTIEINPYSPGKQLLNRSKTDSGIYK